MGSIVSVLLPESLPFICKVVVVFFVVIISGLVYVFDSERRVQQVGDERARKILNNFIFPKIREKSVDILPDSSVSSLRVNVMLYRRRDWALNDERKLWPCKKSLQIEFYDGEYGQESELKWLPGEGICGTSFSSNKIIVKTLDFQNKEGWNMTKSQFGLTDHVGSVVSIPIYADEDKEKNAPIGVLNLDTEEEIDQQKLQELGKELRPYTKYIGCIL